LVKGRPGARLELDGEFQARRKWLPLARLKPAAPLVRAEGRSTHTRAKIAKERSR
jgi:hypothetical protein